MRRVYPAVAGGSRPRRWYRPLVSDPTTTSAAADRTPEVLLRPVTTLPGVGDRRAEALGRLGVRRIADLLLHVPFRYERHLAAETIEAAAPLAADGRSREQVTVVGEVAAVRHVRGRRSRVEATLEDDTGTLALTWFNAAWLSRQLHPGARIRCVGHVEPAPGGLRMTNPRWERLTGEDAPAPSPPPDAAAPDTPDADPDAELVPVYPATEGLPSRSIAALVRAALPLALPALVDHLPAAYRAERDLPDLATAFRLVHMPEDEADARAGRRRLAFDELLLLQLAVAMKRARRTRESQAPVMARTEAIARRIEARLPFAYTADQRAAVEEIGRDLGRDLAMNRLLQGDVGAGKTVVALDAMLVAVAHGRQGAMVAPTELLAEQHHASIAALVADSGVRLALLTGSTGAAARRELLAAMAAGELDLVVGTHALLTDDARFHRLGVAVIDEQHRFGVNQRAALRERSGDGSNPHVLVMTATPIPRTLALTVYGDLDVSTIRGLPPGRKPVATRVMPSARAGEVYAHLADRVRRGEQGFVVVPAIDPSPDLADVAGHRAKLASGPLAGARIDVIHGRMNAAERDDVMGRFRAGDVDVLVATTVIEVGVDVPNATMIVIEHADRYGLAQLHQLRGRVGRGSAPGLCVLVADPVTEDGERRLEAIRSTTDGFEVAEADLEIRGPGEVFGTRQSGIAPFRVADLTRDMALLRTARRDAMAWIERSPELGTEDEAMLRRRVLRRHGKAFGLGDVG
jgi:ATP-dependent DNA helicase RecG